MRRDTVRGGGRGWTVEDLVSAGGIVYRPGAEEPEVVLCGRSAVNLWGLPKGTPEARETLEETARREVREETGLDVAIVRRVGEIEYWFSRVELGKRFRKRVYYYLMAPTGGDFADHDHEYDQVRWVPVSRAAAELTFPNEAAILRRAIPLMDSEAGAGA